MKRYLANVHNITLEHDELEREARELILNQFTDRALPNGGGQLDCLTKIVKAAFEAGQDSILAAFEAGQDSILAEINDDLPADAPKLKICRCGYASCTTFQFSNMGKFTQGAGFTMREALRIQNAWLLEETLKPYAISVDEDGGTR